MKLAYFHNFTTKPFTARWNGKEKTFKPGARVPMDAGVAAVFAKHLANQELLAAGDPKNENYTSPKRPGDVPAFKELYDKAFILVEEEADEFAPDGVEQRNPEPSMNINEQPLPKENISGKGDQIASFPDDEDEEDEPIDESRDLDDDKDSDKELEKNPT